MKIIVVKFIIFSIILLEILLTCVAYRTFEDVRKTIDTTDDCLVLLNRPESNENLDHVKIHVDVDTSEKLDLKGSDTEENFRRSKYVDENNVSDLKLVFDSLSELYKSIFPYENHVRFEQITTTNIDVHPSPNHFQDIFNQNSGTDPGLTTSEHIFVIPKLKEDRTCIHPYVKQQRQKLNNINVYSGPISLDDVLVFVNQVCGTFRDIKGRISPQGLHQKHILENIFHSQEISNITMKMLEEKTNNDSLNFCEEEDGDCSLFRSNSKKNKEQKYSLNDFEGGQVLSDSAVGKCDEVNDVNMSTFKNNFLFKSKPVIIRGAIKNWPAFKKWSNKFFYEKFGEKHVHIKIAPFGNFEGVEPISEWEDFEKLKIPPEIERQLLFKDLVVVRPASISVKFSKFLDMITLNETEMMDASAYLEYSSIPEYLPELTEDIKELPFVKGIGLKQKHLNIWLSDGNTLGKLHFDPFDNFLCQINGKKQLTLFEPHENENLYEAHIQEAMLSFNKTTMKFRRKTLKDSTSRVMSPIELLSPDFNRFPRFEKAIPLNCTINEGDVLFMPSFWWHEVQSYPNKEKRRNLAVNFWYEPFFEKEFPCPECRLEVNPVYRHLL